MSHEMCYRAGIPGRAPGWHCSCGGWTFAAKPMPLRRSGNNKIEADRAFRRHTQPAEVS